MNLRFKIIFFVAVYVIVICIIGNMFLFLQLHKSILSKEERLDITRMDAIRTQIDQDIINVHILAVICSTDPGVLHLGSHRNWTERQVIINSIDVQQHINTFLKTSPVGSFIDKMILFNEDGLFVQAQGRQVGSFEDPRNIMALPLYDKFTKGNLLQASTFGPSISDTNKRDVFILLYRIRGSLYTSSEMYLYIEAGIDMITRVLSDYGIMPGVFAQIPETGMVILGNATRLSTPEDGTIPVSAEYPFMFRNKGRSYRIDRMPLENGLLVLYNRSDITGIMIYDRNTSYILLTTIFLSLCAAAGLWFFMSASFTWPIRALINKIHKISKENDFSRDLEIEKSEDELGLIGKAINEMSENIKCHLVKIDEQYRQQKNIEIALLQTQINPHFLYNTLDSIQWVARIQKNPGIADIISRLINLLREIMGQANSNETHKIPLAKELHILENYTEIMSLRFMGCFEVENRIPEMFLDCLVPRLILQPIVENAIIHGVIPSGKFGTITISALCQSEFLDIIIEDSGVGMSKEQLSDIKTVRRRNKHKSPSLNNIGIENVEKRLQIHYGKSCGLFFESEPGKYTRAIMRIKIER